MRFITVRELRASAGSLWKQLHDGDDVVVTLNGKPVALLLPADERFLERELEILRRSTNGNLHEIILHKMMRNINLY